MAHFAKLDNNNNVLEVIVVNNDVLDPINEEQSGVDFLTEWSEGYTNWKQTSYNGSFRKNFAGIGCIYDSVRDAFIHPKPHNSWILNSETCQWESPVKYPNDGNFYLWDEVNQSWNLIILQSEEE
jgi:hypothetical protein